jgi:hypothetical protein
MYISSQTDLSPVTNLLGVTSADAADNAYMTNVVGNKQDTLVQAVGTTKSGIAYLKGLIQLQAQGFRVHDAYHQTGAGAWEDIVNVSDKGWLIYYHCWCYDYVSDRRPQIRVIIDGVTHISAANVVMIEEVGTQGHKFFLVPFNTSLQVQHYLNSGYIEGHCIYLTD